MKRIFLSAWMMLATAGMADAQCAMCRTALSHQAGDTINRAIVILLVPAVAMFGTIFLAVCRYAGPGAEKDPDDEAK
jgi:hypothetical protein